MGAPTLQLDLRPGTVTTKSRRPPIAELNGNPFLDLSAFLKQLAQRYDVMDTDRSVVSLALTRCGSPAPEFSLRSAWGQLMLQLGTTRSDWQLTTAYTKKFTGLRQHVGVEVLSKLVTCSCLALGECGGPISGSTQSTGRAGAVRGKRSFAPKAGAVDAGSHRRAGYDSRGQNCQDAGRRRRALTGTMLFLSGRNCSRLFVGNVWTISLWAQTSSFQSSGWYNHYLQRGSVRNLLREIDSLSAGWFRPHGLIIHAEAITLVRVDCAQRILAWIQRPHR